MTSTTVSLRSGVHAIISRGAPEDAAAVVDYLDRIAAETDFLSFGAGELGRTVTQQADDIQGFTDPSKGLMLKAVIDSELAGLIVIHRKRRPRMHHRGELGVSVAQKFWGLGLGRDLCEAAIVESRHIGLTRIELCTREDNARALRLCEDLGFQIEGRLQGAFRVGAVEYDELVMALRLQSEGPPASRAH